MIDEDLLRILICPVCGEKVHEEQGRIVCRPCGRRYPIRDGVPILIADDAEIKQEQ
ncbi:MAG: Trm112 family protein [Phycisphaerae bacterium]|jgi:hypothetical protein|nr:Trm112 family protein [Phycisphaerae bacterium]